MPFTSQGVADKVAELYRLSDDALSAQAGLIRADIRPWLAGNFSLSQTQSTYLATMDNVYLSYISFNLAIAIQHRIQVDMVAMLPGELVIAKWITVIVSFELKYMNGNTSTGGLFRVLINYA